MTFNVRYGTANDGDNRWANRKAMVFDVIRDANADLVGLQEALDAQLAEIVTASQVFGVVGIGRDDGKTKGEYHGDSVPEGPPARVGRRHVLVLRYARRARVEILG